jgi:hypothetical protein
MMFIEVREARQQPVGSETRHRTDRKDLLPIAWPNRLDPFGDFADGGPHAFQESISLIGQQHASAAPPKKTRSQMLFQTFDALAHRPMGDVQLFCGAREIQVAGGRFEEAKHLKWRKCARHTERIAALTANVKNHRWPSSHQHRIIQIPGAHQSVLRRSGVATAPSRARPARADTTNC